MALFYASPNLTPALITPQLNVFHFYPSRNLIQTPYAGSYYVNEEKIIPISASIKKTDKVYKFVNNAISISKFLIFRKHVSLAQASHSDFGEKNYEFRTNFTIFS